MPQQHDCILVLQTQREAVLELLMFESFDIAVFETGVESGIGTDARGCGQHSERGKREHWSVETCWNSTI